MGWKMGIPRKKSRRIDVDGKAFLWLMKPGCYCYEDCDKTHGGTVTFQIDEQRPGRVCQTYLSWSYPDGSVTPEIIRQVIRRALDTGWDPNERGGAFHIDGGHISQFETKASIIEEIMDG